MGFKDYLQNLKTDNPNKDVPPEGQLLAGPKIEPVQIDNKLFNVVERDGHPYIYMNEILLKEELQNFGIIITDGILNYDYVNGIIEFKIQTIDGELSLEQLNAVQDMFKKYSYFITNTVVNVESVSLYIYPSFKLIRNTNV